ncbi:MULTISPECIES: hypothetical protein [Photorhabdus]|nr:MULTISPECIES: hypothetical protein [Photorhabdus]MCT8342573.1 hypothetical protein [Photorhabdus kleinii]
MIFLHKYHIVRGFSKNRRKLSSSADGDIRRKAQRALGLATATYPG